VASFGAANLVTTLFLPLYAFALVFLYLFFGRRLTVTIDRDQGLFTARSRTWPLPRREIVLPLSRLQKFVVTRGAAGARHHWLCVREADGRSLRLVWCAAWSGDAYRSSDRLDRWIEDEMRRGPQSMPGAREQEP